MYAVPRQVSSVASRHPLLVIFRLSEYEMIDSNNVADVPLMSLIDNFTLQSLLSSSSH